MEDTPRRQDTDDNENSKLVEINADLDGHQRPGSQKIQHNSNSANGPNYGQQQKQQKPSAYTQLESDRGVNSDRHHIEEPPRAVNRNKIHGGLDYSRQESFDDLQKLLDNQHPPVPKGWDYLCLPRRVNLKRVQEPMVEILADYYEPVRKITYPLAPKGIVYVFGLAMLSLMLTLLSILVFRWREYSIWFVVGFDFIYTILFLILISKGKQETNEERKKMQEKCESRRQKDMEVLDEETKTYEINVKKEFFYFEYINLIRQNSRKVLVKTNLDSQLKKLHFIMDDHRKLMLEHPKFTVRFLNEELRNSDIYMEGTELRRLATVKELFASHMYLFWMANRHLRKSQQSNSSYTDDEINKFTHIRRSVQSLIHNVNVLQEVTMLINQIQESEGDRLYTVEEIENILSNFEGDLTSRDEISRAKQVQILYNIMQQFFMRKAGVQKLKQDDETDDELYTAKQGPVFSDNKTPVKEGRGRQNDNLALKSTQARDKDSPYRINAKAGEYIKPLGDKKNLDNDIKTEESMISEHHEDGSDADFNHLRSCLAEPASKWEVILQSENLKVERRRDANGNDVQIRCYATLPKIRKEAAFQAFSDIKTRRKWDNVMQNLRVIEQNEERGFATLYYNVKTLPFMSTRDALVQMKVLTGFPYENALAVHHKSIDHPAVPEEPTKFIRLEQSIYGLIFEDSSDGQGCKLSWVIKNDLKGIVPRYIIDQRATRNPQLMIDALTQVCQKIMTNTLF